MAITASVIATGVSATSSTVVSFSAQPANTQLCLVIVGDDYATGTPSGWTQMWTIAATAFHGNTGWRKTATGSETSVTYTIGTASRTAYILIGLTNVDTTTPVDVAGTAQFANASSNTYTTPTSGTSTAGSRYGLAAIGGSNSANLFTGIGTWINSYAAIGDSRTIATPGLEIGLAGLGFSGGGTTSSGATMTTSSGVAQSRTGAIIVFREASAAVATPQRLRTVGQAVNRSNSF